MSGWYLAVKEFSKLGLSDVGARVILYLFLVTLFNGCNEVSNDDLYSKKHQAFIEINDTQVPIFPTADEQLNYTRSWFINIQEKRATLQAFIQLYSEKKELCGVASLDLAYLQLGLDYRFAKEYAGHAAVQAYENILLEFNDFPSIAAKAHWYIGWIYADLLHNREKGIKQYMEVVRHYPDEQVSLLPPAPWVSIIYPDEETLNTSLLNRPVNHWAALALLEIIRYSDNAEAWDAFLILWQKYRDDVAVGLGLKIILQKRFHTEDALIMARQYMEQNFSNVHILSDIQKELDAISDTEDNASG